MLVTASQGFRFAWPIPTRAWVTETASKDETTAKIKYEVILSEDTRTHDLLLQFRNYSILELGGTNLDDPSKQKIISQTLALMSAMPTIVISREGEIVDIRGLDEMVARVLAAVPDKELQARLEKVLKSPQMMQTARRKIGDLWLSWVSLWSDTEIAPEETVKGSIEVPMLDGTVVEAPAVITHRGFDKTEPSNVI